MNLDDLKSVLKLQHSAVSVAEVEKIASRVRSQSVAFDQRILRRDLTEYFAIVIVAIFFATYLTHESMLVRVGVVTILLSSVLIIALLIWGGKGKVDSLDVNLKELCEKQLARVERQIWLLKNVWWWYIGPLLAGASIFAFGLTDNFAFRWSLAGMFAVTGWGIYRLNQVAIADNFLPLKKEIRQLMSQFDGPDERALGNLKDSSAVVDSSGFQSFIQKLADESCQSKYAGMAIGVFAGEEEYCSVAGYEDSESKQPITDKTIFEIGSLSKLFTSLLLADSVVRNETQLDSPVQPTLGDDVKLPTDGQSEITWRSLANHRSSLPRLPEDLFEQADMEDPYAHYDQERLYTSLNKMSSLSPIGSICEYSNLGVGLLGHALGKLAGSDFHVALRERVLSPLGMKDTYSDSNESDNRKLATSYKRKNKPTRHWDFTEVTVAAGGIRSCLNDMLKFLRANVQIPDSALGSAILEMRKPSDMPLPHGTGKMISFSQLILPYKTIAVMLFSFAILLLITQFISGTFSATGFLFAPFLLLIFAATFHIGFTAGIITTIASVLFFPEYFFTGFGGFPELIWSAVFVFLGRRWKQEVYQRGAGEGRLAWQVYPMSSHELLWHNGMVGGAASYCGIVAELGFGVVVLTNTAISVDSIGDRVVLELISRKAA